MRHRASGECVAAARQNGGMAARGRSAPEPRYSPRALRVIAIVFSIVSVPALLITIPLQFSRPVTIDSISADGRCAFSVHDGAARTYVRSCPEGAVVGATVPAHFGLAGTATLRTDSVRKLLLDGLIPPLLAIAAMIGLKRAKQQKPGQHAPGRHARGGPEPLDGTDHVAVRVDPEPFGVAERLTAAEALKKKFREVKYREAYDIISVDSFLDRAAVTLRELEQGHRTLSNGEPLLSAAEARSVVFKTVQFLAGYDTDQVDAFMGRVTSTLDLYSRG